MDTETWAKGEMGEYTLDGEGHKQVVRVRQEHGYYQIAVKCPNCNEITTLSFEHGPLNLTNLNAIPCGHCGNEIKLSNGNNKKEWLECPNCKETFCHNNEMVVEGDNGKLYCSIDCLNGVN